MTAIYRDRRGGLPVSYRGPGQVVSWSSMFEHETMHTRSVSLVHSRCVSLLPSTLSVPVALDIFLCVVHPCKRHLYTYLSGTTQR